MDTKNYQKSSGARVLKSDTCIVDTHPEDSYAKNYQNDSSSTLKDYFALTKPGVTSLVVFSSITGMVLAPGKINLFIAIISIFATYLGSASAASINMWYDIDIDSIMQRTQKRPTVRGIIKPDDAITFGVTLGFASVFIMAVFVGYLPAFLLIFSILFYVFYTVYLKRYTPQNIVIGGISGAVPPMIGYTSVTNNINEVAIVLFLIIFFWTPAHFWALSLYRSEDYRRANIPMMPIVRGDRYTKIQIIIYASLTFLSSLSICIFYNTSLFYVASATILGGKFVIDSIALLSDKENKRAPKLFGYSIIYLFLLFGSLLIEDVKLRLFA